MIFDQISNCGYYTRLSEHFTQAFAYIEHNGLDGFAEGRYEIDGDRVYAIVQNKTLKPWCEGLWEAHQKYADIHLLLKGEELFGVRAMDRTLITMPYCAQKDVLLLDHTAEGMRIPMKSGDFVIVFPGDVHRSGIQKEDTACHPISRRVVMKVRI